MIGTGDAGGKPPSLERLNDVFERSPVALTLADATAPDMPLVLANPAFRSLTGYGDSEVVGRNCRFLQDDLPNLPARAEAREIIARAGQGQMVFRNRRKTGEAFDNMLFLHALKDRTGHAHYFLGSQFLLEPSVTERMLERHIAHIDTAVMEVIETQVALRAEQRRMLANAAHAVANAWLTLN